MSSKHSGATHSRIRLKPAYFDDDRQYEFVVYTGRDEKVIVALFHDPGGLMDEVFGFTLTPQEASAMGRALLEAGDFSPSASDADQ
jgi:hypothetical protein